MCACLFNYNAITWALNFKQQLALIIIHCRAVLERHLGTLASVSQVSHKIYYKDFRGL